MLPKPDISCATDTSWPARAPQQVACLILDVHPALAVDGTVGLLAAHGIIQQGFQLDLAAIDLGPASLARAALLMGGVGDGVGLHRVSRWLFCLSRPVTILRAA